MLKDWNALPEFLQCEEVRPYWEQLRKKRGQLLIKRGLDCLLAALLLAVLLLPMAVIAILVKAGSPGPALYRQERVTANGKRFRIHKFRTMRQDAEKTGTAVTSGGDTRVTPIGRKLRAVRLDELPQLLDVLAGKMSFVGTRAEVIPIVEQYRPEYYATLLLPAGITSLASIMYKDEEKLLASAENADSVYVEQVLPEKMKYNLEYLKSFGFFGDIKLMFKTVKEVVS